MDLNARQTRQMLLAGTVPFPSKFPSTGTISFEAGSLSYSKGRDRAPTGFVIVQERSRGKRTVIRAFLQSDVAGIFIPGRRRSDGYFRVSRKKWAGNYDRGEWFLGDDACADTISSRLKLRGGADVTSRDSLLRGIVFVSAGKPVLTVTQEVTTAGALRKVRAAACTCDWE
jgi:hypothetical protein